jgi:hypothetical protein
MPYDPGWKTYTVGALNKFIQDEATNARLDFIRRMSLEHRQQLEQVCSEEGHLWQTVEEQPYNCYHKIYCSGCGKLLNEYDSSD